MKRSRQWVNSRSAAEPGKAAIENMAIAWRSSPEGNPWKWAVTQVNSTCPQSRQSKARQQGFWCEKICFKQNVLNHTCHIEPVAGAIRFYEGSKSLLSASQTGELTWEARHLIRCSSKSRVYLWTANEKTRPEARRLLVIPDTADSPDISICLTPVISLQPKLMEKTRCYTFLQTLSKTDANLWATAQRFAAQRVFRSKHGECYVGF